MKRNVNIELFRCLCMAGVVLLHALTQGGYAAGHRGLDNLLAPSVVGFVFISGYFGITCKLKSVLKLLNIGLATYVALVIISGNFSSSFGIGGYWWFLWMYLALMSLTPLVNVIFVDIPHIGGLYKILPILFVVFIWSYAATKIPVLKTIVPSVDGFSPFGVLTFLAVYIAARTSRFYEEKIETKWLMLTAITSGAICWIGFYHYNSPFALLFAGSMFYLFKRLPNSYNKYFLNKIVLSISPSMFSVYLLHTNSIGFDLLRKAEDYLIKMGWNYYLMAFVVAIGILIGCIALDIPRRMVSSMIEKLTCHK